MARRYIAPKLEDLAGNALAGAWLHVYEVGTTDEVDLFDVDAGGVALVQPRTTDRRGEVGVFLADGTGDVDIVWSDSGDVVVSATGRRSVFSEFRKFWQAPVSGGGGSSLHAELTDLATSGHPAAIIAYDGTVLAEIGVEGVATVQDLDMAWQGLGGAIGNLFGAIGDEATARQDADDAEATARAAGDTANAAAAAAAQSAADAAQTTADGAIQDPGGSDGQFLSRVAGVWSPVPNPGGGGGGGEFARPGTRSGFWLRQPGSVNSVSVVPERLYFAPIVIDRDCIIDRVGIDVLGPGGGTVARLGIYSDVAGAPGLLLLDAGTVPVTGGEQTVDVNLAVTPGRIWTAVVSDGSPGLGSTSGFMTVPGETLGAITQGGTRNGWYADIGGTVLPADAAGPSGLLVNTPTVGVLIG